MNALITIIHNSQKVDTTHVIHRINRKHNVTYPYTMKYYLAIKKNGVPIYATIYELYKPGERMQLQNTRYCMMSLVLNSKIRQIYQVT